MRGKTVTDIENHLVSLGANVLAYNLHYDFVMETQVGPVYLKCRNQGLGIFVFLKFVQHPEEAKKIFGSDKMEIKHSRYSPVLLDHITEGIHSLTKGGFPPVNLKH